LLRAASFLNTAAMCYRYVAAVLGNEAGGIRNKIGILRILRTSQIFVLPIMSHVTDGHLPIVTVESQMNYLWFDPQWNGERSKIIYFVSIVNKRRRN
jgi:hypothetical protein